MKWKDIFTLDQERDIICFTKTGHMYGFSNIDRTEVYLEKMSKTVAKEITNSLANAFTGSFITNEELVKVHLRIHMKDEEIEDVIISEVALNRFNDEYREDVRVARKLQERIKCLRE